MIWLVKKAVHNVQMLGPSMTTKFKGITKMHHFLFRIKAMFFVKNASYEPKVKVNILKNSTWKPFTDALPPIIN